MNSEAVELYNIIKRNIGSVNTNQSRENAAKQLKGLVLSTISAEGYYRNRGGKIVFGGLGFRNRRFRKFFKKKYNFIGLPQREMEIFDKMVYDAVDNLELSRASIQTLSDTVFDMDRCATRAKSINESCNEIVTELEKISNFMDTGTWAGADK